MKLKAEYPSLKEKIEETLEVNLETMVCENILFLNPEVDKAINEENIYK